MPHCQRCGVDLQIPPSWNKKFCSSKCRRNERLIPCPKCGELFLTWDSKKAPKTCGAYICCRSRQLSQKSKDMIATTLSKSQKTDGYYSKDCLDCGKKFFTKTLKPKYCPTCRAKRNYQLSPELCRKGAYNSLSSRKSSKIEGEFGNMLPEGFKRNDREFLNGLEIDYLYDDLAVEYNGAWHYNTFHEHYESLFKRDRFKNIILLRSGRVHYVVGWAIGNSIPQDFLQQHAYFIEQYLTQKISPFIFNFNRVLFEKEYKTLVNSNGKSGYICHNIVNWYHNYRWFQKTKTHGISAVDFWDENPQKVIENRKRYSNLNPTSLRRYFLLFDYTPSLFPELLAMNLAKEIKGNVIVDPFSGYGNRLLGVCSTGKEYIGYDINSLTSNANKLMAYDLSLNARFFTSDSSRSNPIVADGLITCPPYFDKDLYGVSSDLDYYDMIYETFRSFKFREFGFVVVKPSLIDIERFKKAVGNIVAEREVNWGGLGRKSIHMILVVTQSN